MNKPQKELYLYENEDYELMVHNAYVSDLEKYCDELEQENKKLKKAIDGVAGFLYVHGVGVNLDE